MTRQNIVFCACNAWLADRETSILHQNELSLVLGFLSVAEGVTGALGGHQRHTDAAAVSAWIDKYCRENPLKSISDASWELITELAKPR